MDDLSCMLNNLNIGCNLNDTNVNHMFYADDTVLLATCPTALQSLIDICSKYVNDHELIYNAKKTKCMVFKPKKLKDLYCPKMILNNCSLDYTDSAKYLGCILSSDFTDDADIGRLIRSVYARGNTLISKFRSCSISVKCKLFKSHCSSFYGSNVWCSFNVNTRKKLIVAYKQVFRSFLSCKREATTSQMLNLNIPPYQVLERKYLYGFLDRIYNCDNAIVKAIVNAMFFISTKFYKRCNTVLYT